MTALLLYKHLSSKLRKLNEKPLSQYQEKFDNMGWARPLHYRIFSGYNAN